MRVPCLAFWFVCAFLTAGVVLSADEPARASRAVVAIGDVHGDFETFFALLRKAALIDEAGRWDGGARHLVQTGDLVDRGAGSRQAMELMMKLQKQARDASGRVVVLLGNHEVMNLIGDLRYVLKEEFAAYAGKIDERLREEERQELEKLLTKKPSLLSSDYYRGLARRIGGRNFGRAFPPGYFAHRAAFSLDGRYGKWLAELPFVHKEAGIVFVHGGLSERYGLRALDEINAQGRRELLAYLEAIGGLEELGVYRRSLGTGYLRDLMASEKRAGGASPKVERLFAAIRSVWRGMLLSDQGPIWSRDLALGSEARYGRTVRRLLEAHAAHRIVVGHSRPEGQRVTARFGGRVLLIDTGMNQLYYRGTPSAVLLPPGGGDFEVLELPARSQD